MPAFAYTPVAMRIVLALGVEAFGLNDQTIIAECLLIAMAINPLPAEWRLRWCGDVAVSRPSGGKSDIADFGSGHAA